MDAEYWAEVRARGARKREANLKAANPEGWTQHTPYHWSRILRGQRLDYWPSTQKFMYADRVYKGDVNAFIEAHR